MQETSLLLVFVRLLTLVLFFAFRLFASFNVFSIRIPLGFFVLTKLYQRRKELYEVFNCYLVKTVKSKKNDFFTQLRRICNKNDPRMQSRSTFHKT